MATTMAITEKKVRELAAVRAVQFTGRNSKEVAAWVSKVSDGAHEGRAGGSYVDIKDSTGDLVVRVTKNEWVLYNTRGIFFVRDDASFRTEYEQVSDKSR